MSLEDYSIYPKDLPKEEVYNREYLGTASEDSKYVVDVNNEEGPHPAHYGAEKHIEALMDQLGMDRTEPGLKETPMRFLKYLLEFNQSCDLVALLKSFDYED